MPPTMKPGTKKDQPQGELGVAAQNEGIIAPRMFPARVRDVHMPIRSPRLKKKTEISGKTGGGALYYFRADSQLVSTRNADNQGMFIANKH